MKVHKIPGGSRKFRTKKTKSGGIFKTDAMDSLRPGKSFMISIFGKSTAFRRAFFLLGTIACLTGVQTAVASVSVDKLRGEAFTDMGQLVSGTVGGTQHVEDDFLTRMGVTLTAEDTVENRLVVRVGVGGLFWQGYPQGDFWQNSIRFGPGITEVSAKVLMTPNYTVEGGYFPFKYNGPAMNLGEYLLRSESYPTMLTTGGWNWVDSAYTRVLGVRLQASHFGGAFRHEAGVYVEMQTAPLFDISPAYLFSWKPFKGMEIGGGVALKRWFQPEVGYTGLGTDPSEYSASRYWAVGNFPEVQNHAILHYTYDNGSGPVAADTFVVWRGGASFDASTALAAKPGASVTGMDMIQQGSAAGVRRDIKLFLQNTRYSPTGENCWDNPMACQAYLDEDGNLRVTDANGNLLADTTVAALVTKDQKITRRAVNLMGRAGFDFAEAFDLSGTGPFKVYAEAAVLGVQNQPVYYENVYDRLPVMIGVYVPTFGVLDLLAVEAEYLRNPNRDSPMVLSTHINTPLPGPSQAVPDLDPRDYELPRYSAKSVHTDDWKWSVHAIRTLVPGLALKVQVANDHFRLHKFGVTGPSLAPSPLTLDKTNWYYLAHLQWGF
jgi:hypothetical protein